jgi:uncharacterized damage-inducible protein DinB
MTKDDIQLLYEYDRWANARVFKAASMVTPQQFTQDLGGGFRSLRDTLVHLVQGEWIWLQVWNEALPDEAFFAELDRRRDELFRPDRYPDLASVKRKLEEIEKDLIAFLDPLTDQALERVLIIPEQAKIVHLMQHVANHSTYHRGQASLLLRQLGAQPLPTDFHVFIFERACEHEAALKD